jgi:hypothetical protein
LDYDAENALAMQQLRTDFKAKVEILQLSNGPSDTPRRRDMLGGTRRSPS